MKKNSTLRSAFLTVRVLIGLLIILAGVSLAVLGSRASSSPSGSNFAKAQQKYQPPTKIVDLTLLPAGFDCSKIRELGIDRQENFRAGLIMIACGEAEGGSGPNVSFLSRLLQTVFAPFTYGGTDVDLITGAETSPHVTQSETFSWTNPDNPNQIVVTYNDSRTATANYSGASYSSDGGLTFTRLNPSPFATGHGTNFGDPVVLYNRPNATWHAIFLASGCGSFNAGIGDWTSTDGGVTWAVGACVHNSSNDDRESGWSDMNPSSAFYGRMYVSFNNFAIAGPPFSVTFSTDNGATWSAPQNLPLGGASSVRNVQITGDLLTGDVYVAGMNEMGGGLGNRANMIYRSTDGGATWALTYTGPPFAGPGSGLCSNNSYFASMFGTYWRHMGWGEPAALNHVVHYVYAQHGAGADAGDVYYIRSTDSGVTFSAPLKLNTDATTTAQWQPNLSVNANGSLFAMWYDGREGTGCTPGVNTPCYRMWGRKSTDNGVSWQADMAYSDVISPLPGQPDPNVSVCYAGDYDYGSATAAKHVTSWLDGRNPINGASQQDAYFDQELVGAATIISAVSRMTHGGAGTFDIDMPLTGSSGVEDRSNSATHDYSLVVTFSGNVTVTGMPQAQVITGTGCVGSGGTCDPNGTVTVSGAIVTVPLTNIADQQVINVQINGVNGASDEPAVNVNIPMGFLIGDVNGNRAVNASDVALTKSQLGQNVGAGNFREDVNANGAINAGDVSLVKSDVGHSLPP